jgi:hypothetical protein
MPIYIVDGEERRCDVCGKFLPCQIIASMSDEEPSEEVLKQMSIHPTCKRFLKVQREIKLLEEKLKKKLDKSLDLEYKIYCS